MSTHIAIGQQYDLELDSLIQDLHARAPQRVLIQVPEGLKHYLDWMMNELRASCPGITFIVNMDPCYGACDLADDKAKILGCDLLVHFGHSQIYIPSLKTIFVPVKTKLNVDQMIMEITKKLQKEKITRIGLVTTTQFGHFLPAIQEGLNRNGIQSEILKGSPRVREKGQVLGCNYTAAHEFDTSIQDIVFVGDGIFHPIGLAFSESRNVMVFDPVQLQWKDFAQEKDHYLRQRIAMIEKARQAKKYGIILSTKKGQLQLSKALECEKMIREAGKESIMLSVDLVNESFLLGPQVDCWVNTSCPRITTDDPMHFTLPMVSLQELEIALGKKEMTNELLDEIL